MGANYYAKDVGNEKFLLYRKIDGEEHIHGEYNNLRTLSCAFAHICKYSNYYKGSLFRIRKVKIAIVDVGVTEEEQKRINKMVADKNIQLSEV